MKKEKGFIHDMERFVGLIVLIAAGVALSAIVVYGLLGYFETSLRIVATIMVFCIIAAFVLGLQIGRATVRGIEHGLDLKLDARSRAANQAKPVAPALTPTQRNQYGDLLPPPESQRATIVTRQDSDSGPLEI